MFQFLWNIIFDWQLKLTLNLSFLKNLVVLFYKYGTVFLSLKLKNVIQWKTLSKTLCKTHFWKKKNQEAQYQFADNFNSNNFNFTICTPWFNKLWQSDLKLTSETALGFLLKGWSGSSYLSNDAKIFVKNF